MNKYWTIGYHLPRFLAMPLFGDRELFGYLPIADDKDWQAWQALRQSFYEDTQQQGAGRMVNVAGYKVMQKIDMTDRHVLEIGPGSIPHIRFWNGRPKEYTLIDYQQNVLDRSISILKAENIDAHSCLINSYHLPISSNQVDIVISFYSLEHLYPLGSYIGELKRVLRPGGILIGAIPAEGGLAWGAGRFLTSRHYIKKRSKINPDKIISWMHPNFADTILTHLSREFDLMYEKFWPFLVPFVDLNLVISFVGRNRGE